jgi:hypothetical protein
LSASETDYKPINNLMEGNHTMKNNNHITQMKGLIKATVIALSICSLTSTNRADASEFNTNQFIIDAKAIHLTSDELGRFEAIPDTTVRGELDKFIDYDKSLFSEVLDDICDNIVGRTMFKILIIKLTPGQRIKIVNIGHIEEGKLLIEQEGSSYLNYAVKINPNVYDSDGVGLPERQYYCLNEKDNIAIKRKSIVGSLFHEFTHCLHHIEDVVRYKAYRRASISEFWTNKEESRTISGYVGADCYTASDIYDPICDNCFEIYKAVSNKNPDNLQVTYNLRIGHIGYKKGKREYSDKWLSEFYQTSNANFNLAWPKQYLISSKV